MKPTRLERFTDYILRHRWQALVMTFVVTFIPIIGIVGTLIAALVTLVVGLVEGGLFMLAATLPYIISFFLAGHHEASLPVVAWAAVGVAVLSNVLTWVFAAMLNRQCSWTLVCQVAALMGVLVISVIHLAYPDVSSWWGVQLKAYYEQAQAVTSMLKENANAAVPAETQLETIKYTQTFATGLMVAAVLFNAVMQLVVARWWQAVIYSPGSLKHELRGIRLGKLAGGLFILAVVLSWFGNSVISDIMPVLYLLFAAAGLSLMHYLLGLMHSPMAWFWLTFLYITLLFAAPASVWLVAMIGLADVWMNFRKRIGKNLV